MVVAASPSPAPAPHAAAHPTYTQMITRALTELGGCSARPGIAGYILDHFSGLLPCHDGLLSAHLRRLVADDVLRTDGTGSPSYSFGPRKDGAASTPVVKRGRGRPRKTNNPQGSAEKAHTPVLPAKRKRGLSPTPVLPGDGHSVTKRGPGRPTTHGARAFQNLGDATTPVQSSGGAPWTGGKRGPGRPRKEKPPAAAAAMSPQPGTPPSTGSSKRGPGRPRKEKPPAAAAMSPQPGTPPSTTGSSKRGPGRPRKEKPPEAASSPFSGGASRGYKRGCGRPTMDKASAPRAAAVSAEASMEKLAAAAAAMYAETGGAAASTGKEAGGGQSSMEKLAAAVAAMSAEGIKRGRGRPRKEKPPPPAAEAAGGVKRSRGRPGKVRSTGAGLVESAYEAFFRDMMAQASTSLEEEDSVSGKKTSQTEEGVAAPEEGKETSAPVGATGADLGPANLTDDAASTGIKRPRGRPRKNKPAAADDGLSTGVKRGRGRPRKEKPAAADDGLSTGFKRRGRGRPGKEKPAAAATSSPETGDAVSRGVKRGRGRPRKHHYSTGTGFAKAAGEVLFRDVTEDLVSGEKTRTEGAAPVDRKETRVAGAGRAPVSGGNGASAPVSALGSDSGPANL